MIGKEQCPIFCDRKMCMCAILYQPSVFFAILFGDLETLFYLVGNVVLPMYFVEQLVDKVIMCCGESKQQGDVKTLQWLFEYHIIFAIGFWKNKSKQL